ncbi:MAG TPA: SgcJ/EcaC family oxidoreductase [Holophagaceae bacterium]
MDRHPVEALIEQADAAINREDFDTLMRIYAEDAVLVVKPGLEARGRAQIRKAFESIAAHFGHSLAVEEAGLLVLEAGDTALVLARTVVSAATLAATVRNATYVFRRDPVAGWQCTIDNSYGHDLIRQEEG